MQNAYYTIAICVFNYAVCSIFILCGGIMKKILLFLGAFLCFSLIFMGCEQEGTLPIPDGEVDYFTISYNGNGCDSGFVPENQIKIAGYAQIIAANEGNLSKTGYIFTEWNTRADGSGISYKVNDVYTENESVTLYAQYKIPQEFTITYDANGATSGTVPESQTKLETIDLILQENSGTLYNTRHPFCGWNTKADGTGIFYAEGDVISVDENITLYAMWAFPTVKKALEYIYAYEGGIYETKYIKINADMEDSDWTALRDAMYAKNDLYFDLDLSDANSLSVPKDAFNLGETISFSKLKNITLPKTIKTIGAYAFYGARELTSITVPDSVEFIGIYCLPPSSRSQITSIYLGKGLKQLSNIDLPTNSKIYYPGTFKDFLQVDWSNVLFKQTELLANFFVSGKSLEECILNYISENVTGYTLTLPEGITKLGDYALYWLGYLGEGDAPSRITQVILPSSLKYIGSYAFYKMAISSISIPVSVEFIGAYAFAQTQLVTVTIPEGVKRLEGRAFRNCSYLESANLPTTLEYIGYNLFYGCDSLSSVYWDIFEDYKDIADGISFTRTIKGSYSGLEPFVITKEDLLASAEDVKELPEEEYKFACPYMLALYFLQNPSEDDPYGFFGYNLEIE